MTEHWIISVKIVVYEKKLDFSTALSKMQEYIKMFPDDKKAAKELIFLQSRNGEVSTDTAASGTNEKSGEEEY